MNKDQEEVRSHPLSISSLSFFHFNQLLSSIMGFSLLMMSSQRESAHSPQNFMSFLLTQL